MGTVLQIVIKTLRSMFGHFTSNDKPRFTVNQGDLFIRHRRSENSPFIMKNYPADAR